MTPNKIKNNVNVPIIKLSFFLPFYSVKVPESPPE